MQDNTLSHGDFNSQNLNITLKTLFGLEQALVEELSELGFNDAKVLNRAVQVKGSWKDVYFLNLHSRLALTVLVEIAQFRIREEDDLYKKCMRVDWTEYFISSKTFAIKGAIHSTFFKHSQYPFLVVKVAIVDTFRDKLNTRPDVDVKNAQVVFDLYINNDVVTLSLNTSGQPLYMRGYRTETGEAPINEVLAAGLLRLAKWDKQTPLLDPFCGSGTILIEAALYATGIPSTIERHHYAFKNFKNYNAKLWEEVHEAEVAKARQIRSLPVQIMGGDLSDEMVLKARRNFRALPFGRFIDIKACDFADFKNFDFEKGMVITNPPYGERLKDDMSELYDRVGTWMKHSLPGFDCWMITSSEEGLKSTGLKPSAKIKLFNGNLECSYRKYSIFKGSKKELLEKQ